MSDYELFTSTDAAELWSRIDVAAERFAALAASADPGLRLHNSSWTTRDSVGHVLTVVRRYTHGPTLGETPRDVDRINADELAALGDTSCAELLDDLRAELKLARELWGPDTLDLRMRIPFHGGVTVDAAAGMSNLIGEFLLHGRDLARTARQAWPIEARDAVLILNGVMQILPAYAVRSDTRSLRVKVSVAGARPWLLGFESGELSSEPAVAPQPADVAVRARAEALMLLLYARLSPLQAALQGVVVVGGRKPWRVAWLPSLLEQP